MSLIFFKDYADVATASATERKLVPSTVIGRLNLQTDRYSAQFPQADIQRHLATYRFVNASGIPIRKWGLDPTDTNLLLVPKATEVSTAITGAPTPAIPSAQIDKRGAFLGFAMKSLREHMDGIVVYDDYTIEVAISVAHENTTDDVYAEFVYDRSALLLEITIELGSISPTCIANLFGKLSEAYGADYDVVDFFEDIDESGIEGRMRIEGWAQSLVDFVR